MGCNTDPRPDMTEDSGLWIRLLDLAEQYHPGLAESLVQMRQHGTRLKKLPAGGYGLRPQVSKAYWPSVEAYKAKAAKLLKPYHKELTGLLGRLSDQIQQELNSPDPAVRAAAQIDIYGCCAVKSRILNDVVYFARDPGAASRVRSKKFSAAVYMMKELQVLTTMDPEISIENLRQLNQAKKIFGGEIGSSEEFNLEQINTS